MRKRYGKYGMLGVLVLALLLALLLAAGPAIGAPKCASTFTFYGGLAGEVDPGQYYFDTPAVGNLTVLHWRMFSWEQVSLPGAKKEQSWSTLYDWSMVLLDQPDGTAGWHYHWGTGIVSTTLDPSPFWPSLPPKKTWLWTAKFTGVTTPDGVHYIHEYWKGCNRYKGLTAYCTWTMADPDFQDVVGTVRILR